MRLVEWKSVLDTFLTSNELPKLQGVGTVSAKRAERIAHDREAHRRCREGAPEMSNLVGIGKIKLRDCVSKIGSGLTPTGGAKAYSEIGTPLIRSQNVRVGGLILDGVARISNEIHEQMASSSVCEGDVLLNITGASIGRSCVVPQGVGEANVNQHVCIIRTNEKLDPECLSQFLNSYQGQKQIWSFQGGGSREGLNYDQIGSFEVPKIELNLQRKIAEILRTWDEALKKLTALRALNIRRRVWFRTHLFMSNLEGIGKIKLRDCVSKIGSGLTPAGGAKAYSEIGTPLIRSQNVRVGGLILDGVARISNEIHEQMASSSVCEGDVLLNITGASIGRSCVVPQGVGEANVNQHVCIIRTNEKLDPEYLSQFLNSYQGQKQIWSFQGGGSREGLNYNQIGSFEVPKIELNLQRKIAEILRTQDEALALLDDEIEALTLQKRGLMQKLLTGEWRVEGRAA